MLPIEQSCYWLASRKNYQPSSPLSGETKAQIVIVGGGFTGLWSAWFIKQLNESADVALVEQGVVGYGASGRNAGMVSNCIDHSHALAISHFGREEAERLMRLGISNIDEMEQFAVGCDFERTGQLNVALTPAHLEEMKHGAEIATGLGLDGYKFLSADEIKAELNSPIYLGGLFVPGGGIVDPIKLVDKLKRESEALGVKFYERTKVTGFDGSRVITTGGSIQAEKILLSTDAYTHHLFPQLLWHFIPLYDYVLVSDPMSDDMMRAIGWRNRQGVTDGRTFFNYYRLTADNRFLWGTSEAMYYAPNRVDESCDHSQSHYDDLLKSFKRHFPQLDGLNFPYRWGGPIASTTRLTPFFGSLNGGNILYALGYTGHGIGTTRLAGKILAHMALEKSSDLLTLKMVTNKPFPYPPEPLRSLSVNLVTSSLRRVDQGEKPNAILKMLDAFGLGFSS